MLKLLLPLPLIFGLAGCVTINIYFPAAEAQRAADKIIEEVWQLKKPESKTDKPAVTPGLSNQQPTR